MLDKIKTKHLRLKQRHQIIATIRKDLYEAGFLEVETPLLVKNTTPDVYIESIQAGEGYLITSTEYQIKRLIAQGLPKIFTLCKNFRAHDRGKFHNPEFTMLEWGRATESLHEIEEDVIRFIRKAFSILYPKKNSIKFNGYQIDFMNDSWDRLTVKEAFKTYLGLENLGNFSLEKIINSAQKAGVLISAEFQNDRDLLISYLLDLLQSHLGKKKPIFLHEWPTFLTSSAPINSNDPNTTERSELYIGGVEVANGFPFLTNPQTQRILFEEQQSKRKAQGKPIIALDIKYIDSLKNLPIGAGMALGIDRLIMILTGASQLSDVITFDWNEL
jgi:lysyl-tRNA synthetase class 2